MTGGSRCRKTLERERSWSVQVRHCPGHGSLRACSPSPNAPEPTRSQCQWSFPRRGLSSMPIASSRVLLSDDIGSDGLQPPTLRCRTRRNSGVTDSQACGSQIMKRQTSRLLRVRAEDRVGVSFDRTAQRQTSRINFIWQEVNGLPMRSLTGRVRSRSPTVTRVGRHRSAACEKAWQLIFDLQPRKVRERCVQTWSSMRTRCGSSRVPTAI